MKLFKLSVLILTAMLTERRTPKYNDKKSASRMFFELRFKLLKK